MYKIGMICKHFKGHDLLEKNIYTIVKLGVDGKDIDENIITYTGDKDLLTTNNLVVYSNIFQDNKMFAREYEDLTAVLDYNKQKEYNQTYRVQPLTMDELKLIDSLEFKKMKKIIEEEKHNKGSMRHGR